MALYHLKKGSVNYTVVGSPTIVDGVVSGFSGDNYLQTTLNFDNYNTAEILVKITTPQTMSFTNAYFLRFGVYYQGAYSSSGFRLNNNNTITFYPGDANPIIANNISSNTTYWLKGIIDRVNKSAAFYISTDNENYTLAGSLTNMTYLRSFPAPIEIGTSVSETGRFFEGLVDLNNTYIKVNGQPWFGVCPFKVQKHQLKGPIGYTVEGSLAIADGVASGFSSSDYLVVEKFPGYDGDYEFQVAFTITATGEASLMTGSDFLYGGFYITGGKINFAFRNMDNVSTNIHTTNTVTQDVPYIANAKRTGNTLTLTVYKNGVLDETVTTDLTGITASPRIRPIRIGQGATGVLQGSINLNSTYIKVDDKLWFWQPQETKRIVVNGVEVWTKPA